MSSETIADAIRVRFESAKDQGSIEGLARIFTAPPVIITEEDFETDRPLGGWGGVCAIVALPGPTTEVRVALGGEHGGWKRIDYPTELRFMLRWSDTDDNGENATRAMRRFIDGVKAWIRADRTADSDVVWQWGEQSLTERLGEPAFDGTAIQLMGAIQTVVTEFIQS